mgnify:CR=1 FL=1
MANREFCLKCGWSHNSGIKCPWVIKPGWRRNGTKTAEKKLKQLLEDLGGEIIEIIPITGKAP